MVLVQELGLEPGHVDVRGALALAGLAFEAQVEHLADVRVGEAVKPELAGDGEPQQVGAAAGAVLLLAGRLERRAHRPLESLSAGADAGAQLGRRQQAAVGREVEGGWHRGRHITRAIPQVRRQRRGVDDLAGVEQVVRVERTLQLAEGPVQHRAIHLLLERAADQSVAVLARERAAIPEHQLGDLAGDRLEPPHAVLGL